MSAKFTVRSARTHWCAGLYFPATDKQDWSNEVLGPQETGERVEHTVEYLPGENFAPGTATEKRRRLGEDGQPAEPNGSFAVDDEGLRQLYEDREIFLSPDAPKPPPREPSVPNKSPSDVNATLAATVAAAVAEALAKVNATPAPQTKPVAGKADPKS